MTNMKGRGLNANCNTSMHRHPRKGGITKKEKTKKLQIPEENQRANNSAIFLLIHKVNEKPNSVMLCLSEFFFNLYLFLILMSYLTSTLTPKEF